MARNHTAGGDKKERPKERSKDAQLACKKQKEKKTASLSCGRKLCHSWPLSNVACMSDLGDLIVMGEVESEEEQALNPSYLIMSSALMLSIPNF